ncbi:hypothetical protein DM860_002249 [Cuscuta australis]|uniref:Uncharacterized protein n=1 Tax=Cuscuta australis TaxID=267555 RepID=A0A328D1H0_9ASTE|nr:hypothetical protein DM860_002249 [Cuscuta australis]
MYPKLGTTGLKMKLCRRAIAEELDCRKENPRCGMAEGLDCPKAAWKSVNPRGGDRMTSKKKEEEKEDVVHNMNKLGRWPQWEAVLALEVRKESKKKI